MLSSLGNSKAFRSPVPEMGLMTKYTFLIINNTIIVPMEIIHYSDLKSKVQIKGLENTRGLWRRCSPDLNQAFLTPISTVIRESEDS